MTSAAMRDEQHSTLWMRSVLLVPQSDCGTRDTPLASGRARDDAVDLVRDAPGDLRFHVVRGVDDDEAPGREPGHELALVLAQRRGDHLARPRPRELDPL